MGPHTWGLRARVLAQWWARKVSIAIQARLKALDVTYMRGDAGAVEETLLAYGESISRPSPLSFTARSAEAREVGCDEIDTAGCGRRLSRKR